MKLAFLLSGGKDSLYAAYLAKQAGHELVCAITIYSKNKDSYMFHTPCVEKTKKQAKSMSLSLLACKTKGEKEKELKDLEKAIKKAKQKYNIQGIVTGAIESCYQASRIQKICDKLNLECFNPLWQKPQLELLNDLIKNGFKVIVTSVAAYPLNPSLLGRKIDKKFIHEIKLLQEKFKINPAGEGGEFETFVLNCPLFSNSLKIIDKKITGKNNSWKMEVKLK